jgi:hypothetical protein
MENQGIIHAKFPENGVYPVLFLFAINMPFVLGRNLTVFSAEPSIDPTQ